MNITNIWDLFPGFYSFMLMEPSNALIRVLLIIIGLFLVYMGYKDKLDSFLFLPIGFTMAVVSGGISIMGGGELGTLFTV
jgi:carboxybiotin decarboxylase